MEMINMTSSVNLIQCVKNTNKKIDQQIQRERERKKMHPCIKTNNKIKLNLHVRVLLDLCGKQNITVSYTGEKTNKKSNYFG